MLGMTTAGDTEREIGAVMERSRGHFRGQDKTIAGIHGCMLFQAKVRLVVFDRPVGIEIAGRPHRLSQLIQVALWRFSFAPFFFQLASLRGWLADCTKRASMAMPSWMANPREANYDRSSWLMAFMVFWRDGTFS